MASSSGDELLPVGRRLLPSLLTGLSRTAPNTPLAVYATSSDLTQWRHVSYCEFERAVDNVAWWLRDRIGTSSTAEVISYIGTSDIRYMIFWIAAIKCGFCTLNPSPRNATPEHAYLLCETKCNKLFFTDDMKHKVSEIKDVQDSLRVFQVPALDEIMSGGNRGAFGYDRAYDDIYDQGAIMFHTSGSTGMPKPIPLKHSYFAVVDSLRIIPHPPGRKPGNWTVLTQGRYIYSGFPLFHVAGAVLNFASHLFQGTTTVIHPPDHPLIDATFLKVASVFDIQCLWAPPSYIEDLASSKKALERLASVEYVFSGGGPTPKAAGDAINAVTTLVQLIGNTEMAAIPTLIQRDWLSFEWNPYYGLEMEPTEQEGVYEAILRQDPKKANLHAIFLTFPELKLWRTRDLFTRTPGSDKLWRFAGRTDDVVVLSNGEKFNPITMQMHIQSSPLVKGVLVVGQGRFQVALLVEPEDGVFHHDRPEEFIDAIWPTVQEANDMSTATGMVFKNMILVATPGKPFVRAPKGTIIRGRTIAAYDEEISVLYQGAGDTAAVALPEQINEQTMEGLVEECLQTYLKDDILDVDAEFTSYGVDSLQTLGLAKSLSAVIKPAVSSDSGISASDLITPKVIYQHPTIRKLSHYLVRLLTTSALAVDTRTRREKLLDLANSYSLSSKNGVPAMSFRSNLGKLCVVLTGTTKSLGTYLLSNLVSDDRVAHVYCFNRTADAHERSLKSLKDKDLNSDLSKVEFLHTTLGSERFGLRADKYRELLEKVDVIVHNAWAVNFQYPVESFSSHINAVAHIAEFSIHSAHHAHVYFVSTIGTVSGRWEDYQPTSNGLTGERIPEDTEHSFAPIPQGYAESKYVSERILCKAVDVGVDVTIVRVGQVAGPTTAAGKWNETDWLPRILSTSKLVGKIPTTNMYGDDLDWVPVDKAAQICIELLFSRLSSLYEHKLGVYHLVNPRTVHWSEIVPTIQAYFKQTGVMVEAVELDAWIDAVRKYGLSHGSTPVSALLEATSSLPDRSPLDQTNTIAHSETMKRLTSVSPDLVENWLKQWNL